MVEQLIGTAAKIRQGRPRHCSVEGEIHHRWELAKVSEEQAGAASKEYVSSMGKHLTKTLVHLTESFPSHHRHFVNDEILHVGQRLLNVVQPLSLQVLVLPLDREAEKRVEGVAFDVEGCYTSRCSNVHSIVEEKSEAVDEVGLTSPTCP